MTKQYDVIIVGSGMGGLSCANILSQEGLKVLVLEKNQQLGGNLQIFTRDRCIFDTGVHYIGGLEKGQNLYQLFKYFGIYDDLKIRKMDTDGFDQIHFYNEKVYYKYAMGYDHFVNRLTEDFPHERKAITLFVEKVKEYIKLLPLAQLKLQNNEVIPEVDFSLNAKTFIHDLVKDKRLREVLGAINMLYAGNEKTPFYVHALILNSYIESAFRCIDGTSQIASLMAKRIKELGGEILNKAEVCKAHTDSSGRIVSVELTDGRIFYGNQFISNLHPQITIDVFGEMHFKKHYVKRIQSLKNTGSVFTVNIVFQENTFEYINHNIFHIGHDDVWDIYNYQPETWPSYYMISCPPNSKSDKYTNGLTVVCGMSIDEVLPWKDSYNTVTRKGERGNTYENFKLQKAQKVVDAIEVHFPGIKSKIKSIDCSTPLTFRDYTGTPDGAVYGVMKESDSPIDTLINPKTGISNLFLTGQNITMHGILGVSFSALLTCFNIIDKEYLLNKINHFNLNEHE